MSRTRTVWSVVGVGAAVAVTAAIFWFTPWKVFTTTTVADDLPTVASTAAPSATVSAPASPAGNQLLAQGTFVSHAHRTSGTAQVVLLTDGRRQLVIRDLKTSDGPDVRVWLTDQPVPAAQPYNIYANGRYVELGPLKGNAGDLVYDIPAGTDLSTYTSVDLWCKRFAVSFGAATLS